jgi:hypothetical protein
MIVYKDVISGDEVVSYLSDPCDIPWSPSLNVSLCIALARKMDIA